MMAGSLCARPLERLLDLGPRRVRQLGGLVASLLEQPGATRLCLAELLARLTVRVGDELPGLVAGRGQDLVPLALALLAEPLDVALALLDVLLALAHFLLGALKLRCRGAAHRARGRRRTRRPHG